LKMEDNLKKNDATKNNNTFENGRRPQFCEKGR
jgi:hypothetical protein